MKNGPNGNISPGAVTGSNLINLAAVEKTKRKKNIIELQYCFGMSRREVQKNFFFFFNFQKNWVGRVGKTKNKKLWP